ncbi:hypothetical protein Kpol_1050p78 [Vanderwaltozyma polyspora DSM 70294]|uniref:6-phosphogluconolactonase-like protein n=1 Tax=Vanderwaltozyma polyspora (strain ATCC 22028 / DSM 70294 / BCRC 21397 / CBS 2163 / NBRC 10782 / NRRL Y-8283 / UCD 57-17) TaxID=436907 RepID=A7TEX2_VANPO|nr:uncharacterized protein Kpol_1050p78 [Vanderwaltozyma polyspora DSM 70294]EDO19218.1 hypothetical protein Kpol_1050p78 [Vanderwaltozyma polyspora DSM 70294]
MAKVYKFASSEQLAGNLGSYVLAAQEKALSSSDRFNIAISGGSLVEVLRDSLILDKSVAGKVNWNKWNVFFCDERIVPLNHPDSNYGAFKKHVLNNLSPENLKNLKVFTLDESLVFSNAEACEKIAEEYESILPASGGFDLLLLGCGPDGHTCSLFPGQTHKYLLDEKTRKVMYCHDSPKPPSDRITITLPVIGATKETAFVAQGASKQPIMHKIFDLKDTSLPSALVTQLFDKKISWFVDDAAFETVTTTEYY